jgi:hypothetical protein
MATVYYLLAELGLERGLLDEPNPVVAVPF